MSMVAQEIDEPKVILTAEEAESLLPEGDYVHNYKGGGAILLGVDYGRAEAVAAFKAAHMIEIGGPSCKAMRHPLAVWKTPKDVSFFEADMAKVEAFEAARSNCPPSSALSEESK
jgi:hypothetical protein